MAKTCRSNCNCKIKTQTHKYFFRCVVVFCKLLHGIWRQNIFAELDSYIVMIRSWWAGKTGYTRSDEWRVDIHHEKQFAAFVSLVCKIGKNVSIAIWYQPTKLGTKRFITMKGQWTNPLRLWIFSTFLLNVSPPTINHSESSKKCEMSETRYHVKSIDQV